MFFIPASAVTAFTISAGDLDVANFFGLVGGPTGFQAVFLDTTSGALVYAPSFTFAVKS
jgi:hypothetical protein